jgi:AraC-like DNA-binding protein
MSDAFVRYQRLFHEGNESYRLERGDRVEMILQLRSDLVRSDHLIEFVLATWVIRLRRMTGRPISPLGVDLAHAAPGRDDADHRTFFGSDVRFERGRDALVFTRDVLALPVAGANRDLTAALEQSLARELAALGERGGDGIAALARDRLREALLTGRCDVTTVSKALAMSERTLQRRLGECGTTFQALLDDVRRELALAQLERGAGTLTDLAFTLGYADLSAFSRAFRRWTGESPVEYRRRILCPS